MSEGSSPPIQMDSGAKPDWVVNLLCVLFAQIKSGECPSLALVGVTQVEVSSHLPVNWCIVAGREFEAA